VRPTTYNLQRTTSQSGQILLLALVFMVIVTSLVVSLVGYAASQIKAHRQAVAREQGINIAEAGAELAIWKLNNQAGYSGETNTSYGNGVYSVTITNLSGTSKLVKVDSYVPNATNPKAHRTVQITTATGTENLGFNYGVQIGAGGLTMDNNSQVNGNIYSNGDIIGANTATVTGDVIVATTHQVDNLNIGGNALARKVTNSTISGNVSAYTLSGSTVTGNVSADSISDCTVNGNAVYNSRDDCTVVGTSTTPNDSVPQNQPEEDLPIDQSQIDNWQQEATDGGTVGSQTINGTVSLGPVKINGDLQINGTLNVTGTIWVTGSVTTSNGSTLKLDSSYGSLSGILVAGVAGSSTAGTVTLSNNSEIRGSGTTGSYLMVLSQKSSITSVAIDIANNASGAIYYAGTGLVNLSNNAHGKEITAYKVHLNNGAIVTYESGLGSSQFSSGPAGGWQYLEQTYQLLQ
jgi:cytoskeletal protein CcmA (bactofilin family)